MTTAVDWDVKHQTKENKPSILLEKKVRKKANIRNRYNQVPHLTQDIIRESDKNTRKHYTQESQEVRQVWVILSDYMSHDMRFPTMWYTDQQRLRPACAYAQSDQSL